MNKEHPASLWRNRDYNLLVGGQAISVLGTEVSDLAYVLLVLMLTRSPAQVGLIGACRAVPWLLFSIPAGVLVDRWDRKRVMVVCDCVRVICMGSVPVAFWLGYLTLGQLYATAVVEASCAVLFDYAERACLRQVVTREQLPAAVAQNQTITFTALLIGPALSGLLYAVGRVVPFLVDALSYVVSVVSLVFIKTPFQQERKTVMRNVGEEMREGMVWLWRQPLMRFMTLQLGALNLTVAGINVIMVVLAQRLHASSVEVGIVIGVGSVGGIIGGMIAPLVQKRLNYGQAIIGICWITALIWPLFVMAPNLIVLAGCLALYMIWGRVMSVVNFSYRTALTPDALQGRVLGVAGVFVRGSVPVGMALTGVLLQNIGAVWTVLVIFGCRVAIAVAATLSGVVRKAPDIVEVEAGG